MKVGEVYMLRCVGLTIIALVVEVYEDGFLSVDLESGDTLHWHSKPTFGRKVGEWQRFGE